MDKILYSWSEYGHESIKLIVETGIPEKSINQMCIRRILKIYTKTGDDGTTGLQGGTRLPKSDVRIRAYGMVDEINSCLGIVLAEGLDPDIAKTLVKIQNDLFVVGSDLSNPDMATSRTRVSPEMIGLLEESIDRLDASLEPLANFVLPGGHKSAAFIHLARTITRRAESELVALSQKDRINPNCQKYLNRLADLLFVLSRVVNKRNHVPDTVWKSS